MKEEITAGIAAHGQWKARLRDAIATGKSEFNPLTVKGDNNCAFGKWLYGLGPEGKSSPYYAMVKEKHAKFHQTTGEVLALALAGKKDEATKLTAIGSEYAKLSAELVGLLQKWAAEAK